METTRNVESKIQERQRLDEQHELERLERERQLAIAREAKKHYKSPPPLSPLAVKRPLDSERDISESLDSLLKLPEEDLLPLDPIERPTFDRATKPQQNTALPSPARVRDFSPVKGQNVVSDGRRKLAAESPCSYKNRRHTSLINKRGVTFRRQPPIHSVVSPLLSHSLSVLKECSNKILSRVQLPI